MKAAAISSAATRMLTDVSARPDIPGARPKINACVYGKRSANEIIDKILKIVIFVPERGGEPEMRSTSYGVSKLQLGVPLSDDTLAAMSDGERAFWMDFLEQADVEIKACENSCDVQPYAPSESLAAKYNRALGEFDGGKYCQMKYLGKIFVFPVS
jgi:hypothetical protein